MKWTLRMKFLIAIGLVTCLSMGAIFYWNSHKQEEYILQQVEKQSRILFQQILMTRQWVAKHGGVFVEKLPGIETNPFLKDPEIQDRSGRIYTKRNPALVTRELSDLAEKGRLYKFRVTSLRLLDPKNAPDEFERSMLQAFERGDISEANWIEPTSERRNYRYIAPLFINESCLECHGVQGYKIGDIKGGISIMIPLDEADHAIRLNNWTLFFSGVGVMAAVIFTLYLLIDKLVIKPVHQLKEETVRIGGGYKLPILNAESGDEIDSLKRAFREMDLCLKESRDHLEEKIRAATKDLEGANLKLQELDRMKSDFVSNISHELRTPLTAIRGAVDYLMRQGNWGGNDFLEIIKKNAERLIRMVTDLLDFSRIEAGKMEMQVGLTNLSFLVEEVVAFVGNMAAEKKIQIEKNIPDSLWVMADEDRIRQVLINLLSNAIKFSPTGSRVDLYAGEREKEIRVYVKDHGAGVAPENQERIFMKFQQIGKHPRGKEAGVGLGLAISKGIIEAHGGRIWLESQVGQGSTFIFSLPKGDDDHGP